MYIILGWFDIELFWDENIVYFYNWKKTVLDQYDVGLFNFHQQIIVISHIPR